MSAQSQKPNVCFKIFEALPDYFDESKQKIMTDQVFKRIIDNIDKADKRKTVNEVA